MCHVHVAIKSPLGNNGRDIKTISSYYKLQISD